MDYEHRRVRWYWVALFLIYCVAAIYGVLTGNPYLYSHSEYKKAIQSAPDQKPQPIPSPASQLPLPANLGSQTYFARVNAQRNGDGASDVTWGKSFVEKQSFPLNDDKFQPTTWAIDGSGVYLAGGDEAVAFNLNGEKIWAYQFADSGGRAISEIVLDQGLAYLIHMSGEVVAVNKASGQLQWDLKLRDEVIGPALISGARLLVPLKAHAVDSKVPRPMFRWAILKRATGELSDFSKPIEAKPKFDISVAPELQAWILSYENKLVAVDPEKLDVLWTQTLTDPFRGPVAVVGRDLYVSSLAGKILKLDGAKKGRIEWEAEMQRPPVSSPTFMPIMNKLAVLDDQGALQLLDTKLGKPLWRYSIENHNHLKETWAARMKGSVIQETNMDWVHRGWSVWAGCSKDRFCIYNPSKGQLISRVPLSGSLLSPPVDKDKVLYFLVDQGKNWALARVEQEKATHAAAPPAGPAAAAAPSSETH